MHCLEEQRREREEELRRERDLEHRCWEEKRREREEEQWRERELENWHRDEQRRGREFQQHRSLFQLFIQGLECLEQQEPPGEQEHLGYQRASGQQKRNSRMQH